MQKLIKQFYEQNIKLTKEVSKLNSNASVKQTWNMIRIILGKRVFPCQKFFKMSAGPGKASSKKEIVDSLGS